MEGIDLQGFLKWYAHFKKDEPETVRRVLDALVPGNGTEEQKLQAIRNEIEKEKAVAPQPGNGGSQFVLDRGITGRKR